MNQMLFQIGSRRLGYKLLEYIQKVQNKKIQEPETIVDASSILDDYEYLLCFSWLYF